jgi:hypothetical protein
VLREMRRVVATGALVLIAFHAGDEVVHVDNLFGAAVGLDFHFFPPEGIAAALGHASLPVIEQFTREPYEGEYPSRRCYLLSRAH